jgi:hypothetical protein
MHREERQGSEEYISFAACKDKQILQFFIKESPSSFQTDSQISVTAAHAHRHIHLLSPNRWKAESILNLKEWALANIDFTRPWRGAV